MVVEGGPTLHEAFANARVVDRVEMFLAKVVVGPDGHQWSVFNHEGLYDVRSRRFGDDVLIEGYTRENH
jgi:riboflavin biosynthesis pyrimidine reductase